MSRRKCCCFVGCEISQDDFNREDSTDIGTELVEVSGEWVIDTNTLVCTDPGVVVSASRNPYSRRAVVYLKITPTGAGPWEFWILVNASSTGGVSQYAKFAFSAAELTITAGGQSRSYDTGTGGGKKPSHWVWPSLVGESLYATVCLTDGLLYAALTVRPMEYAIFNGVVWDNKTVVSTSGYGYAGVKHLTGELAFDDWKYDAHYDDNEDCPVCICRCAQGMYPPWRIRVDLYDPSMLCPCYDGGYGIYEASGLVSGIGTTERDWICVEGVVCAVDISYFGSDSSVDCGVTSVEEGATQTDWDLRIIPCTDDAQSDSIDCDPETFEIVWYIPLAPDTCPEHCIAQDIVIGIGTDAT